MAWKLSIVAVCCAGMASGSGATPLETLAPDSPDRHGSAFQCTFGRDFCGAFMPEASDATERAAAAGKTACGCKPCLRHALGCVVRLYTVPRWPCHAVPCRAMPCHAVPRCPVLTRPVLCADRPSIAHVLLSLHTYAPLPLPLPPLHLCLYPRYTSRSRCCSTCGCLCHASSINTSPVVVLCDHAHGCAQ